VPASVPGCVDDEYELATSGSGRGSAQVRGKRHWLWRAVDQYGVILDILVQERRDQAAAERFLRRVLGGEDGTEPRVVITDKLASYPPAIRRVLPNAEHRRHKGLNNRAENSHLPTRKRERILQRFKSAEHAQRFLAPFSAVSNHFRPRRHRLTASTYRQSRTQAHTAWQYVTQAGVCH
jgi:putative transposase